MYKILLLVIVVAFSACSHFRFNAEMCEQIASEPGSIIPQECIDYNEEDAQKAFDKVKKTKKPSDKDIIFNQEKE